MKIVSDQQSLFNPIANQISTLDAMHHVSSDKCESVRVLRNQELTTVLVYITCENEVLCLDWRICNERVRKDIMSILKEKLTKPVVTVDTTIRKGSFNEVDYLDFYKKYVL